MRATLFLLAAAALAAGCATAPQTPTAPPAPGIATEVEAFPDPAHVTFRGREVGVTPVSLEVPTFPDLLQIAVAEEGRELVERRIKVLGPSQVRVEFRFGAEPTAVAKALGLGRVLVFDYSDRATFDTDRADLKPDFRPLLERQAELLATAFGGLDVYVCGHTDDTGGADHNLELSLRRARAVADVLAELGVARTRLRVQGLGEDYPLADNSSEVGRGWNRRTEIVLPD
jgi:outer membrane protein OmpA-like peptidoglycan-associated protein